MVRGKGSAWSLGVGFLLPIWLVLIVVLYLYFECVVNFEHIPSSMGGLAVFRKNFHIFQYPLHHTKWNESYTNSVASQTYQQHSQVHRSTASSPGSSPGLEFETQFHGVQASNVTPFASPFACVI